MSTQTVRVVEPGYVDEALATKADLSNGRVPVSQLPDAFYSVAPTVVTIPYAASITPDASKGTTQRCTLTGNVTVNAPINPTEGEMMLFQFASSGGARQVTFATGVGGFQFGTDIAAIPTGVSGKTQYIGVAYRAATGKWDIISIIGGFTS